MSSCQSRRRLRWWVSMLPRVKHDIDLVGHTFTRRVWHKHAPSLKFSALSPPPPLKQGKGSVLCVSHKVTPVWRICCTVCDGFCAVVLHQFVGAVR
eukprot:6107732-Amphidinium_carterae.1